MVGNIGPMNDIRVTMFETPGIGSDGLPQTRVGLELLVDGAPVQAFADVCLSICDLVASSTCDGEFCIGSCTCGEPACAGVWEGVHVMHEGALTSWSVPMPYAISGDDEPPSEPPLTYEFSNSQYEEQVTKAVTFLKQLLPREVAGERFAVDTNPGMHVAELVAWLTKVVGRTSNV